MDRSASEIFAFLIYSGWVWIRLLRKEHDVANAEAGFNWQVRKTSQLKKVAKCQNENYLVFFILIAKFAFIEVGEK